MGIKVKSQLKSGRQSGMELKGFAQSKDICITVDKVMCEDQVQGTGTKRWVNLIE